MIQLSPAYLSSAPWKQLLVYKVLAALKYMVYLDSLILHLYWSYNASDPAKSAGDNIYAHIKNLL